MLIQCFYSYTALSTFLFISIIWFWFGAVYKGRPPLGKKGGLIYSLYYSGWKVILERGVSGHMLINHIYLFWKYPTVPPALRLKMGVCTSFVVHGSFQVIFGRNVVVKMLRDLPNSHKLFLERKRYPGLSQAWRTCRKCRRCEIKNEVRSTGLEFIFSLDIWFIW